jgi:3'(2'), 5'-bisphosphate nucleotidase
MMDYCGWLDDTGSIATDAGKEILHVYERDFEVEHKGDGSPLTEADRAAHRLIVARLQALTPDIPVLSEESAAVAYETRAAWPVFWLVDPLDGTREFVKRNGEFTVNIALIVDRQPVLGVVHVPVSGVSYLACRGRGAWKQEAGQARREIHVRPVPPDRLTVVASRSHASDGLKAALERLGPHETVSMGSSLKLCLVAEGKADLYPRLGPTSEWDTAAAQCVVEVAGGRVTDLENRPLRYNKESILNPFFIVSGPGERNWAELLSDG